MTQVILKQLSIFPTVTRSQLKRLVKSYLGHLNVIAFNVELNHLVKVGLVLEIKDNNGINEEEYKLNNA